MKKLIAAGATDQTIDVFIQDSSSTTGAGKTGLAYDTTSLVCYYRKGATGSAAQLSLATQTVGGAHSDGGFVEVDATNLPGIYRLDLSDTIVATEGSVTLLLKGAANMAPCPVELQITSPTRGTAGTALPNAAADAPNGLPISDAGGLDLDAKLANTNEVTAARMGALTDWIDGGRLDLLLDVVKAKTDNLPIDPADESLLIAATDAIMSRLGVPAGASVSADVAALKVDTAAILTDTGMTLEGHLTDIKGATFNGATDSLEAIRDYTSPAATALSTVQWTNARAGYMDKLNVSGNLMHDALAAWLRLAGFAHNRMTIDDATGDYVVRDAANAANLATGTITDDALTSVRSAPTWV